MRRSEDEHEVSLRRGTSLGARITPQLEVMARLGKICRGIGGGWRIVNGLTILGQ
jgi:hypothetical protein